MAIYQRGDVRIHYEEAGSGFPLMVIPGGGLNSTIAGLTRTHPFDPFAEFSNEYRVICADLRNANGGQSSGPVEADRPWDSYTDDQLGLMDHLGIDRFLVLGFCIGGPFIWNMLRRAPERVVAAVLAQPVLPAAAARLLDLLGQPEDQRDFRCLAARIEPGTELPTPTGVFPRYETPQP